ncbi:MAG: hypothetical protein KA170_05930, partial [Candidatus Promineofilum sp.]|nr:hypothetical protein [Promineifilum sp.]
MSQIKTKPTGPRHEAKATPATLLPADHLEEVGSWGGVTRGLSYVYRPVTAEALHEVLLLARRSGRSVGLRGGGNSYG